MARPIIGISTDFVEEGSFSSRPHVALRHHYADAIWQCGGMPLLLPPLIDAIDLQLAQCDGIMIPGGEFATPKEWYVGAGYQSPYEPLDTRLYYDMELVRAVLASDKPILTICAGMQLMAGMLGGKLTPNVMAYYNTDIDHMHAAKAEYVAHDIQIETGSLLHKLSGLTSAEVNSAHREGVVAVPDGAKICATCSDGVIEAYELLGHIFALSVEWHPEFLCGSDNIDRAILEGLVRASAR